MIWGNPQAFWLLMLVPVLVALYLHRRKTVSVEVPSLLLWQEFGRPADQMPLGLVFRNLLNLLAQVVLLCLLILSLANPRPPARQRGHVVLIVDASATMQTVLAGGISRSQEAIRRAESMVQSMSDDTLFTVVQAAAYPQVLLKASLDKPAVRAALAGIHAVDADSDLQEAVRLGESLQVDGWRTRIACISDFVGAGPLATADPAIHLSKEQVGQDSPNCGIVGLALASDSHTLDIGIGQAGLTGQRAVVTVTAENREVARQAVDLLQPLTTVHIPIALAAGTAFTVQLAPNDSLALDNVAYGVWPDAPRRRVRLVTQDDPYLLQALSAEPTASLDVVDPGRWDRSSPADVTVLDGVSTTVLRDVPGKFVLFGARSAESGTASSPSTMPSVTYWTADHPVLRNVDPDLWRIRRLMGPAPAGARILASASGTPVIYEWASLQDRKGEGEPPGQTQAIAFNFNLADADLPLRPAFPVVLWDAIDYLTGSDRAEQALSHRTADSLRLPTQGKSDPPVITDPQGKAHTMLKQAAGWTWLDTHRQGLYTVRQPDRQWILALNWMSLRSTMAYRPLNAEPKIPVAATASSRPLWLALPWQVLLGAAVAAGLAEWLLFQRRILDMRQG